MAKIDEEVEVWAHKLVSTKFTVPNGSRPQMESAIAERFRSDKELVWEDHPEGISVEVTLRRAANQDCQPRRKAMIRMLTIDAEADKAKALDMFNKGEGGFLDRDLYVFCSNVSDWKNVALATPMPSN
jgi:hypothetical protein